MEDKLMEIIWLLVLTLAVAIKGLVYVYNKITNRKNPISLDVFYKEFTEFKENQEEWNEKVERKLGIWKPNETRRK